MKKIGDFEFDTTQVLGSGAFAKVFKGNKIGRREEIIAIKEIDLRKCDNKKFVDEIRIMKNLKSQYIVDIYDA